MSIKEDYSKNSLFECQQSSDKINKNSNGHQLLQQQQQNHHNTGFLLENQREKKKAELHHIKSREELLEFESGYYENLRQTIIRKRRTKIIATLNSRNYKNYEQVRTLYLAGVSSFLINMAYCKRHFLLSLSRWRDKLEAEFSDNIPLTCVLKGNLVRIGMLSQPETYLRKGQEYRIMIQKKILGDQLICSVDDDNLVKHLGIGAKLIIDYGQVGLTVVKKEKSDETLKYLQDFHGYGKKFKKNKSQTQQITDQFIDNCSSSDADCSSILYASSEQKAGDLSSMQFDVSPQKIPSSQQISPLLKPSISNQESSSKNVFAEELLKQKKKVAQKQYDVLVCTVDSDCILKAFKPIFIYKNRDEKENLFYSDKNQEKDSWFPEQIDEMEMKYMNEGNEDEEYDSFDKDVINPKDFTDITSALNHDVDSICITNVRAAEDVNTVRKYCNNKQVKIIAKIQNLEGVKNFDKILSVSDGVLIARGYLTVHIPVEKLHFKQKDLIAKSNDNLKPVLISCNILDSMVSSLLPTTCEVGEISNLINEYVDSIVLSDETSYGMHAIQAVETLSRICIETEARQMIKNQDLKQRLFFRPSWSKESVINTIVKCTLDAAYGISAKLIIVFTSSGRTALKISKSRPPCPIIAVTANIKVARYLNYSSSVAGAVFPSLTGTDKLVHEVLKQAKYQKIIKKGDFAIVTSGKIENLSGTTNNLKIIQVD